ncbi:GatB/YqeY domain-containing protein [Caminibacter sp.]
MTILELKKMMMKAKKEDKTKANALMMLVDTAQKIAKEKGEEVTEKHIQEAAKKLAKMAKESIEAGMEEAKKELEIYESFLPKMLSEEETTKIIKEIIDEIGGKNMGEIMKRLKQRGDIDMALASRIIKSL